MKQDMEIRETRDMLIGLRVTKSEYGLVKQLARELRLTIGHYIKYKLFEEAKFKNRELKMNSEKHKILKIKSYKKVVKNCRI